MKTIKFILIIITLVSSNNLFSQWDNDWFWEVLDVNDTAKTVSVKLWGDDSKRWASISWHYDGYNDVTVSNNISHNRNIVVPDTVMINNISYTVTKWKKSADIGFEVYVRLGQPRYCPNDILYIYLPKTLQIIEDSVFFTMGDFLHINTGKFVFYCEDDKVLTFIKQYWAMLIKLPYSFDEVQDVANNFGKKWFIEHRNWKYVLCGGYKWNRPHTSTNDIVYNKLKYTQTSTSIIFEEEVNIISLYNINGSLINSVTNTNKIDITNLNKGVYIIRYNNVAEKIMIR